jgi:hypothetical protein
METRLDPLPYSSPQVRLVTPVSDAGRQFLRRYRAGQTNWPARLPFQPASKQPFISRWMLVYSLWIKL